MSEPARIFLVDDHDVVRRGTRSLLEGTFEIAGEADTVDDAIELILEQEPDLVLLDLRLPGGGGAVVLDAVRRIHPDIKFVAFTSSTSRKDVVRLVNLGVDGYITKSEDETRLPDLLERALAGSRPISRDVAAHLLGLDDDITEASGLEKLTPREREVINLMARGYTYRETSSRLEIAVKTLESHISNIFSKLEIATRGQLTALAYEAGFIRPEDDADDAE